ncbi:protein-lysine N-methyltransferase EEF2KMT isoform X2 [Chironomus tepperi]|uniref:protein-lysine N-methyltransferase EEF2KMT isoform X2 n=1 Tax=Chironomus tepperi TaxID=113505 RepID=UPI00391F5EE5
MDCFENIKLNFLSGIAVKHIDFKDILTNLEWNDQESLIEATILHERNLKYPLRKDYQIAFIKHIIHQLELNGVAEIHDKFYEVLGEKIKEIDSEFSYKHFNVIGSEFISLKESNSFIRDGTTGLKLWPAAVTLSNYIISNPDEFNDKSILELGSGCTGLVGLALLKSSKCKQIFLSDCHDTVVNNLIENINLNLEKYNIENLESSLLIRQHLYINNSCEMGILNLPWEEINDNQDELVEKCKINMILAADIVYDSSIFEALKSGDV